MPDALQGRRPQPQHWQSAAVSNTVPRHYMLCCLAMFAPIMVLGATLKIAACMWLRAAMVFAFLCLRRPASHGFRLQTQAAEVHHMLRGLAAEHEEWGNRLSMLVLDIKKACDTLKCLEIDDAISVAAHARISSHRALAAASSAGADTSNGRWLHRLGGAPKPGDSEKVHRILWSVRLCHGGALGQRRTPPGSMWTPSWFTADRGTLISGRQQLQTTPVS